MVYNEKMDSKLNDYFSKWKNISKKKSLEGTEYVLNGKVVAGIHRNFYVLRLGKKNANTAIKLPGVWFLDIMEIDMKEWIMAREDAFSDDNTLREWLDKAKEFVELVTTKKKKKKKN